MAAMTRFRAVAGGVDQLFSSTSNGLIIFAVAVVSTPQQFGHITVLMTAVVAVVGAARGAFGTPLLLKSDQNIERIRREGAYAMTAALVLGPLLGVGILVAGYGAVGSAAGWLAVAAPFVLAQDVLRYVVIAEGRPDRAAIWDGVWCIGTAVLLMMSWWSPSPPSISLLLGGWTGLAIVAFAGLLSSLRIKPRIRGAAEWLRAGLVHRVRYGVDAGLEQVTVFIILTCVGLLTTPAVAAALRGATAILAPIGMFGNAIQLIIISESTRLSTQPRQVWHTLLRIAIVTGLVTATGGLILHILPESIGAYLLGDSWILAAFVLPVIVLEYIASAFSLSLAIFLRTFNRSAEALALKVALSLTMITGATTGALVFHTAIGVAICLALSTVLVTGIAYALVRPWQPQARAASVDIAAESIEGPAPALFAESLEAIAGESRHSLDDGHGSRTGVPRRAWSHVRVTEQISMRKLPRGLRFRRDGGRSAKPALIGLWTFAIMGLLVPAAIIQMSGTTHNTYWIGPVLIIVVSAARFAWFMGTGERRLFELIFWSFSYAFLGLAPLAQLLRESWPVTVPRTDTSLVWWGSAITLVGIVTFLVGVGFDRFLLARRGGISDGIEAAAPQQMKSTIDYRRLMVLTFGAIALNIVYLSAVGFVQFVKSRDESTQALTSAFAPPNAGIVFRSAVFMSIIVAWVALVRYRREARIGAEDGHPEPASRKNLNMVLIVVVGLLLLNSLNPVSNARYLSGTAVLAIAAALGMFATSLRFRASAYGFLLALLVIFPQADAFRYSREANVKVSDPIEALLTPDYDSFAQIVNGYTIAVRDGIDIGNQALGVALFWIPRALWPGKAYDTGIEIANGRGYSFTNLSAPLWIEFFLNGGWVALVIGMFVLGAALHRWDTRLDRELALYSMPTVLGCILPFYMLILLRGSLLQAAPYLFFTLVCAYFVQRRPRSYRTDTPTPFRGLPKWPMPERHRREELSRSV
jgi:hypothetical protein